MQNILQALQQKNVNYVVLLTHRTLELLGASYQVNLLSDGITIWSLCEG